MMVQKFKVVKSFKKVCPKQKAKTFSAIVFLLITTYVQVFKERKITCTLEKADSEYRKMSHNLGPIFILAKEKD